MKKHGWILGWFPLLALAIYYQCSSLVTSSPVIVTDAPAPTPAVKSVGQSFQEKRAEYRKAQDQETKDKIAQIDLRFEKLKQETAELAKTLTPSRQSYLVDATLKVREPRYRSLLDPWHLDPSTTTQVFQVIRERDTELQALRAKFLSNALPDVYAYQAQLKAASDQAKQTLTALLGKNRTVALSKLETEMNPSLASRGVSREVME